VAVVKTHFRN